MIRVGITGGIGSGKTTVCKVWQSLGAEVLNADDLAKKLMVEDARMRREIIRSFGEESYRPDGSLNRTYLAERAFSNGKAEKLNRIVHPEVRRAAVEKMKEAEEREVGMFVYEAALLLEEGRPDYLDYIVLVLADREQRLERVVQRDNAEKQKVLDRMNRQQDFDKLKDEADIIIENNGTPADLEKKARQVHRLLLESSHK